MRTKSEIKYERTTARQREKKAALVEYKGGECCVCGYAGYNGALDFHHTREKNFSISSKRDISLKKLKEEADNTILVCRNCHAEIHAGITRGDARKIRELNQKKR